MLDLNTAPYYDDYNEDKKFYKILFKPGYPVQARELTQIQSILQKQIEYHGSHIFKNGTPVISGQSSINTKAIHIKLNTEYNGVSVDSYIDSLVGETVRNSNGVTALVLAATKTVYSGSTLIDNPTLYVSYISSGDTSGGTDKEFLDSDTIYPVDSSLLSYSVQIISQDSSGTACLASIEKGVFYVNGYFVLAQPQTIVVSKYNNVPSSRIGLTAVESIITSSDDESLLDNARGSFNYVAPGADRYSIDLVLTALDIDEDSAENFFELAQVSAGEIKKITSKTDYSDLEEALARRTYDECGNYVIDNFRLTAREYRNNDRGDFAAYTAYVEGDIVKYNSNFYTCIKSGISSASGPTANPFDAGSGYWVSPQNFTTAEAVWQYTVSPVFNNGATKPEEINVQSGDLSANTAMKEKMVLSLSSGKAMVNGYEITKQSSTNLIVDKPRTSEYVDNEYIKTTITDFVYVTNIRGLPIHGERFVFYDKKLKSDGSGPETGALDTGSMCVASIELHQSFTDPTKNTYKLFILFSNSAKERFAQSTLSLVTQSGFKADIATHLHMVSNSGYISITSGSNIVTGKAFNLHKDFNIGDVFVIQSNDTFYTFKVANKTTSGITQQLVLTENATVTIVDTPFKVLRLSRTYDSGASLSRVYKISDYAVKQFRNSQGELEITYAASKLFKNIAVSSGVASVASDIASSFASAEEQDNYIVVNASTGSPIQNSILTFSGVGTNALTISGLTGVTSVHVLATLSISNSRERTKTRRITRVEFTPKEEYYIHPDTIRIVGIVTKNSKKVITDSYSFNPRTTSTTYLQSALKIKPSYSLPTESIIVEYEYFEHGPGDFFTANSYPSDMSDRIYDASLIGNLKDYIDFRYTFKYVANGLTSIATYPNDTSNLHIKRGQDVRGSFSYYVGRKDKLSVNSEQVFVVSSGEPSIDPVTPVQPSSSMVLYDITYQPYVPDVNSKYVSVEAADNRRYTMSDIRKLERRIENLEEVTSLTMLERSTNDSAITDSDGLPRTKFGFFVDNFKTHNSGNPFSEDYMCSLDVDNGVLRPYSEQQNIGLYDSKTNNNDRKASGYQLYGDVITLPVVEEVPLVTQKYSSRVENVNPFAIFTFLGSVNLTPSSDEWFETEYLPALVVDVVGNYDTIAALSEKAGVLGTVWNSWQTSWTGKPVVTAQTYTNRQNRNGATTVSRATLNAIAGEGTSRGGALIRTATVQSTALQIGQTRTGIQTDIAERLEKRVIDDRVISTAIIPHMRSRYLLVQAKGLKPKTRFWAFFDKTDITNYCTPSAIIEYTLTSSNVEFTPTANSGVASSEPARQIAYSRYSYYSDASNVNTCLSGGDVITGYATNSNGGKDKYTAVVVGEDENTATGVRRLHVVNIKKNDLPISRVSRLSNASNVTFPNGVNITGSLSGATGVTRSSALNGVPGTDSLISSEYGELNFLYWIPSAKPSNDVGDPSISISRAGFDTGKVEFKLMDATTYTAPSSSSAKTTFESSGTIQKRQQTIESIRNAELVTQTVTEDKIVNTTTKAVINDTGWYDPIAQTFLVNNLGGAFLSKVDIFFSSKDAATPVTLEIRETTNGYPGKTVLPFSRVTLKPNKVNISKNKVEMPDGSIIPSYDTATSFVFPSPVFVENGQEYAIVILSDSNNYRVWVSQLGDRVPGTTTFISEQPYAGVLFKSQNASTWTADQSQDLKFTVHRCKFDTKTGYVSFNNVIPSMSTLAQDPFQTASGNRKIRVWHKNHGIVDTLIYGDATTGFVTLKHRLSTIYNNVQAFPTTGSTSLLYVDKGTNIHYVWNGSSYVAVTIGLYPQYFVNGVNPKDIYKTHRATDVSIQCYTIQLESTAGAPTSSGYSGGINVLASRNIEYSVIQPNVQVQSFSETSVTASLRSMGGTVNNYRNIGFDYERNVALNDSTALDGQMVVMGTPVYNSTTGKYVDPSETCELTLKMKTNNSSLSPMIDTHRISAILIRNMVDSPSEASTNVAVLDDITVADAMSIATNFTISGKTITGKTTAGDGVIASLQIGKTSIFTDGTRQFQVTTQRIEIDQYTSHVSATLSVDISTLSGNLTIKQRDMYVDEIAPSGSSSYSKYVTKAINLSIPAEAKNSTMEMKVRLAVNVPTLSDLKVYYRTDAVIGAADDDISATPWTIMSTENGLPISKTNAADKSYTDYELSSGPIDAFKQMQLKIVMNSERHSVVPTVKDLRIIAVD